MLISVSYSHSTINQLLYNYVTEKWVPLHTEVDPNGSLDLTENAEILMKLQASVLTLK